MKSRLSRIVIVFVALALVLGLAATLASDAGAQDSGAAPDDPAKWTQYDVPAPQDLQTTCCADTVTNGFFTSKRCCITVIPVFPTPVPDLEPFAVTKTSIAVGILNRWICSGYVQ